jgi:hypothetical protein
MYGINRVFGEGLDCCYDCTAEVRTLNNYINKLGIDKFMKEKELTNDIRTKCIAIMSRSISIVLGHRRLCDNQPLPSKNKKYYDDEDFPHLEHCLDPKLL